MSDIEALIESIYLKISAFHDLTIYELADALDSDVEKTHALICQLEELGKVERCESRVCSVLNRQEVNWTTRGQNHE